MDIFIQRNSTPGSSKEEPPAKRLRTKTSTENIADATRVQEDHDVARVNVEKGNRYIDTSDDDEILDDSINIPDQDQIDIELVR